MKLRPILIVFAVALLVRLTVVMFLLPQLRPDQNPDYYRELGRNVAAGKGFVAIAPSGRGSVRGALLAGGTSRRSAARAAPRRRR